MKLDPKRAIFALSISLFAVATDASAQKSGKAQTSSLPIRHGYYALEGNSCADAVKEESGVFFRGRTLKFFDWKIDIERLSRRSPKEYDIIGRLGVRDPDAVEIVSSHLTTKVRIISPVSFSRTNPVDNATIIETYRFCSTSPPKGWIW